MIKKPWGLTRCPFLSLLYFWAEARERANWGFTIYTTASIPGEGWSRKPKAEIQCLDFKPWVENLNRLPRWLSGQESGNTGDTSSVPGLGRSPGEGNGNSPSIHGQRSLVGYSPWGRKELDMTEWLSMQAQRIEMKTQHQPTRVQIPEMYSWQVPIPSFQFITLINTPNH